MAEKEPFISIHDRVTNSTETPNKQQNASFEAAKQKVTKSTDASERTEPTQIDSRTQTIRATTAEDVTMIIPIMPETNATTGKSAKVLVWKDLFVSVPVMKTQSMMERLKFWKKSEKTRREVLHGVSGVAEPGEILAIMGASGAGKTTLLNVLTQRNQKSLAVTGEVSVNGEQLTVGEFQRMSSYVQQSDIFMGSTTVREHLIFSARLRMGRRFTDADKIARVDEVITQMNLVNCQHTLIGQRHQKSISLGEKKRLAFGCEILTDPSILFCDEPTSGLDAFMAKQVIKALQALALQGKTIIITIHQPSSQIFNMFNKLCLMALGEIIYFGPPKKAARIFGIAGYKIDGRDNPAEFCIEKLALHDGETEEDRIERVMKIKNTYNESHMASLYHDRIYGSVSERRKQLGNKDVRESEKYAANWFTQVLWLFIRSFRATLRDPLLLKVRLAQTVLTALIVGIVYLRVGDPESDTILTVNGFLFNCVRDNFILLIFPCLTVFADELPIFLRENHGNIYRTDAYFIGKNLAELPQYIILPVIYSIIVFYMAGVHHDNFGQLFVFLGINITVTNLAVSISYASACIFGTTALASQILPLIIWPIMCFGGFFVNIDSVPIALSYMKYISWHRYAFEVQMINKWEHEGHVIGCPNTTSNSTNTALNLTYLEEEKQCNWGDDGPSILSFFGFGYDGNVILRNFGILFLTIFIFRTIAVTALFIRAKLVR